ncbi:MAG: TolC family protein [Rhodospirillaceae bacterium]|nr:TolC family protein [Rhodospirillaceae bacterium]
MAFHRSSLLTLMAAITTAMPLAAAPLNNELAGLLLDHPQIRAAAKTLEASRNGVGQAAAGYFPTVSATAETGHELVDSPAERSSTDGQAGNPSSRTPQTASLTVTHNIFNGFLTDSQVRTARLNKEISSIGL